MTRTAKSSASAIPATEVRAHLQAILESPAFRESKRCQHFLTFVVEKALQGEQDFLRERVIGVEVFGRDPSYDTHDDSVVRVAANEVRRRLAQYYQDRAGADEIRIEIPTGSYVPQIHIRGKEARPYSRFRPGRRLLWILPIPLAVSVAVVSWIVSQPDVLERFWEPALTAPGVVEIQLGQSHAYQLSRRIHDQYLRQHPEYLKNLSPYLLVPTPELGIRPEDIIPVSDYFLNRGDALAVIRLGVFLSERKKRYRLSVESGPVSLVEQIGTPQVLVGAFSNRHTIQTTRDLRFHFRRDLTRDGAVWMIEDGNTGNSWKLINVHPKQETDTDYALITRLLHKGPQRMTVALGGLTQFGTDGAAKVITEPESLASLDHLLGKGWEGKNVQFVVEMRVALSTPVAPRIVIAHVW